MQINLHAASGVDTSEPVDRLTHELSKQLVRDLIEKIAFNAFGFAAGDDLAHIDGAIDFVRPFGDLMLVGNQILFMMMLCLFLLRHERLLSRRAKSRALKL